MTTFVYCRISKKDQSEFSLPQQRADGETFAESIGSKCRVYVDEESGRKSTRKDWVRLKQDLLEISEPGDVVWYGSSSRLGRDSEDFHAFKKICISKKVRLFERSENRYLDFASSAGDRLSAGIKSLIAEEELDTFKDRMFRGLKASWDVGLRVHPKIYGYESKDFVKRGQKVVRVWTVNKAEAEVIKTAFNLYAKGTAIHAIARKLNTKGYRTRTGNTWTNSNVRHILEKILYSGRTIDANRHIIPSAIYPKIIEPEQFDRIGKMRFYRQQEHQKGRPPRWEGSGILKCAICKSPFHVQPIAGKKYYHHKEQVKCKGAKVRKVEVCNLILELAYSIALIEHPTDIFANLKKQNAEQQSQLSQDIERIEKLILNAEKARDNFSKAIATGKATDYFVNQVALKIKEIESLSADREKLISDLSLKADGLEEMVAEYSLDNLSKYFSLTNREERRNMLSRILKYGWIAKEGIIIELIDGRKIAFDYKSLMKDLRFSKGSAVWTNSIRFVFESELFDSSDRASRIKLVQSLQEVVERNPNFINDWYFVEQPQSVKKTTYKQKSRTAK